MRNNKTKILTTFRVIVFSALLIHLFSCTNRKLEKKYNPGHYVALSPYEQMKDIKYLNEPSVQGVNKRYLWRHLEPEKNVYDFSQIEKDLDFLSARDKQLVVFLIDVSFGEKGAMPEYLSDYEYYSKEAGYCPIRWDPYVVERFVALGKAIGEQFDTHPNFEGIAIQESSLNVTKEGFEIHKYTDEKYRDALIKILIGLHNGIPNSNVFWYSNFLGDGNEYLRQIADTIIYYGIFMGGPDILPYRRWMRKVTYPMYDEYKDKLTLFCSVQDCSYKHHKNDIRNGVDEPIHEDGYLTMEDIFKFGRDSLHLKYIIWNYYYDGVEKGEMSYDDAIKVIREYPTFNIDEDI
ncbi:hypothetical protein HQ585_06465 [candidate division KSB1 bacterium]|nr:hypothetical protein [candidate division KSB1 bacterium]